jgi:hypothetical protein
MNPHKKEHIQQKQLRREKKRTEKRSTTADEVIFTFEKVLENWKIVKIYNTIIQMNPQSKTDKNAIEKIATGNCKVYETELSKERYNYYVELRNLVYAHFSKEETLTNNC